MSLAGLSLETATRRGGGEDGWGRAEEMRVRMEARLVERVEAREGEMGIVSIVILQSSTVKSLGSQGLSPIDSESNDVKPRGRIGAVH